MLHKNVTYRRFGNGLDRVNSNDGVARMKFIWLPVFLLLFCLAASFPSFQTLPGSPEAERGSVAVITSEPKPASYESFAVASNDDYSGRQWAIPKTMAPQSWEFKSGEASVVIAVLDTGIDKEHEDLVGKVIAEVNFTDSPTAG